MIKMLNLVSANVFVDLFYAEIDKRIPYPTVASMVSCELDYSIVRQAICDIIDDYLKDKYTYVDAYACADKIMSFEQACDTFGSKLATPVRFVIIDTLSDVISAISGMALTEYEPAVSYDF